MTSDKQNQRPCEGVPRNYRHRALHLDVAGRFLLSLLARALDVRLDALADREPHRALADLHQVDTRETVSVL